jgi:muconolactone delta-isomerase
MYFFATGSILDPSQMAGLQDEEDGTLDQLRDEGTVKEAFRFVEKHGVIGIFEGPSLQAVQEQIGRLPFVRHGVMTFDYSEVVEL